ncbi:DUF2065 domain-containing protein [Flaviflagellibacter deserti]|uniref:DUF2065 domain-containing protein n=1 Tax=Flaviflagellibacter deserti TaxID=2267266 RepID=A0ABV9Z5T9_9HYPH
MTDFIVALGLVLVIEGLVSAAFPGAVVRAMERAAATPPQTLRLVGLISAAIGLALVWLIRG